MIVDEIFGTNNYGLPEHFVTTLKKRSLSMERQCCIDVGAHIGVFALAAAQRGAVVYAFEPHPENFKYLLKNTGNNPLIQSWNKAVWRSDIKEQVYILDDQFPIMNESIPKYRNIQNTGASVCSVTGKLAVESIGLDEIIDGAISDGFKKIDILKLDCEGSEFEILYTSSLLNKVDRIVGELHASAFGGEINGIIKGWREFCEYLVSRGFSEDTLYLKEYDHEATSKDDARLFNFSIQR
tara:strand:+ start:5464 stop:6180 length:717 start_codon:yes stop_codon:yes gene_type:complete